MFENTGETTARTMRMREDGDLLEIELDGSKINYARGLLKHSTAGDLAFTGKFENKKAKGTASLENSRLQFAGQFRSNKACGIGKAQFTSGLYWGEWSQNRFHGYGRLVKSNFAIYEGFFHQGLRRGVGVEVLRSNDLYVGEFKDDYKHGLGLYLFDKGGFYYGHFKQGKRNGFGVLVDRLGTELYKGFWKKSKKSGRGVEMFPSGAKYDGYFEGGRRTGVGMMEYSKQLTYIGDWSNGKKDGFGKMEGPNVDVSGRFMEDKLVEALYVNPSCHYDHLLKEILPESVESYIKQRNYSTKLRGRRPREELSALVNISLAELVLGLVKGRQFRLNVYLLLRNLFGRKVHTEKTPSKIGFLLMHQPSLQYPLKAWAPRFDEMLGGKSEFNWGLYKIDLSPDYKSMNIAKSKESVSMLITNRVVQGKIGRRLVIEGANQHDGSGLAFYTVKRKKLKAKKFCFVFPFFLLIEDVLNIWQLRKRKVVSFVLKGDEVKMPEVYPSQNLLGASQLEESEILQRRLDQILKKKRKIEFDQDYIANHLPRQSVEKLHDLESDMTEETESPNPNLEDLKATKSEGKITFAEIEETVAKKEKLEEKKTKVERVATEFETMDIGLMTSRKAVFYRGEFFFSSHKKVKKKMSLILNIDGDGRIYSVGRDIVGPFVVVGSRWSDTSATFTQKYFEEYEIEFKCFLFTSETIQGNWDTTNLKGGFVLRKIPNFKLSDLIVPALDDLFPSQKERRKRPLSTIRGSPSKFTKAGLRAVESFVEFLDGTVLAVLMKNAQGGVPEMEEKSQLLHHDEALFERYRKLGEEITDTDLKKFSPSQQGDQMPSKSELDIIPEKKVDKWARVKSQNVGRRSLLFDANDLTTTEIQKLRNGMASNPLRRDSKILERFTHLSEKRSRAATYNLQIESTRNRLISVNHSFSDQGGWRTRQEEFLGRLAQIFNGLKSQDRNEHSQELKEPLNEKCFGWKGEMTTLGRQEPLLISNLFILRDRIEGVYLHADKTIYELAGSYSKRTNQFEIVGISICKTRSLLFKGVFQSTFHLEGRLTWRPISHAPSNLKIKMNGVTGTAEIFEIEEGKRTKNISVILKQTTYLIYGIFRMGKSFLFLSGVRKKNRGFEVELMGRQKGFREVRLKEEKGEQTGGDRGKIKFVNKKMQVIIKF